MKNFKFFFAAFMLLAASCSNDESLDSSVNNFSEQALAPVTVHVKGFSVSQEEFSGPITRAAQDLGDYSGINAVTLAFYASNGTEAYKSTQAKGDVNFGEFSLSLPMGSYTMVAVAYYHSDASPLELTSPTEAAFTGTRAYETFATTQEVVISNTNAVDISATLDRVVTQLKVVSTDGKTADVSNVRMTFSAGGKDFNPTTGFAITNTGFANTVGNSAAVGSTSTSLSFLFLATDEQNINVTIETLDADGAVLFSKTVNNVPFQRNRVTKLTGAMYTNEALSGTFQIETAWLDEYDANF
ncbi:MAG: hypothetical protein II404_07415 [Prevotella sp.]|nr:hypothetical protein [Prevotella sp.]